MHAGRYTNSSELCDWAVEVGSAGVWFCSGIVQSPRSQGQFPQDGQCLKDFQGKSLYIDLFYR